MSPNSRIRNHQNEKSDPDPNKITLIRNPALEISSVVLLTQGVLKNRTFYTNENHSAGNIETSIYYQKNTPLKNINLCLTKLLVYSKKQYKKTFFIFQEIFFKKKVSIYDAKYIILPINIENEMLNKIKNILPYIKIIYK